jgi:ArsR family transcriptional regulator
MRIKIEIFKVLSEPNRVRILMMLLHKPLCVCEITSVLGLSTATVSNHLSYLRNSGFIEDEKDGKWINYRISTNINNPIVRNIIDSLPEWFDDEKEIQSDLAKVQKVDRYDITLNIKKVV